MYQLHKIFIDWVNVVKVVREIATNRELDFYPVSKNVIWLTVPVSLFYIRFHHLVTMGGDFPKALKPISMK